MEKMWFSCVMKVNSNCPGNSMVYTVWDGVFRTGKNSVNLTKIGKNYQVLCMKILLSD